MLFLRNNPRLIFYGLWILMGLMQASLTELQDDEAYYWVYSRFPGWGYFDHPPMIAWLIKAGYAIFPNELGVRILPLLLNVLLVYLLEKLCGKKNPALFFSIALSIALIQLLGFLAIPDMPLLFFTALFFYFYKRTFESVSLLNWIFLGIAGSLLLYSKYHGILIFLFVALSDLRLFTRPRFYLACLISLLLFLPHLWWQYQHDWVSFRYHLFESNVNRYRFSHTLEYVLGQLLVAGPLAGVLLLPASMIYKPKNIFERSLRFTLIGIYLFFLLSTLRGKVELNWTSPALVPLFILSYKYLNENKKAGALLLRLLPASLALLLFARIIMVADILPLKFVQSRFHSWKQWPAMMKNRTAGKNVVFSNSFQRASKYWFYTGIPTYSLNLYKGRRNNFDFWPVEDSLLGKPVYFLDVYDMYKYPDSVKTELGWIGFWYDSSYSGFAKVQIKLPQKKYRIKHGEHLELDCSYQIPDHYKTFISLHRNLADTTIIGVFDKQGFVKDIHTPLQLEQAVEDPQQKLYVAFDLPRGNYYFLFAIRQGKYFGTHNSGKFELVVE
jgi:hypothetical protein